MKNKTILFLGAGATHALGMPMTDDQRQIFLRYFFQGYRIQKSAANESHAKRLLNREKDEDTKLLCKYVKAFFTEKSFTIMDFYNLIDMQIRLGRTCCIDNGDHIGIPEAMKIRKAMLVLLQELFSMYTEEAMGTEKEKALEDFKNFFKDLAQLCLEEKRAMLSDPHLNPCSSDFLISNLSYISLNWDILFVWCMFIAHKELNDRNSDHYVIHGKNVKLKIFNDFATFMAARKPGYDTEDNLNIKRWYPYNESVATRINDPEHLHDRIITLIRTYLPHGSTNWLECPECGKLSMYLGNAWELHSPSIAMEKGKEYRCLHCQSPMTTTNSSMLLQTIYKEKTSYMEEIQQDMRLRIHEAKRIVFIGYSLPDDDIEYRSMFTYNNAQIKKEAYVVLYDAHATSNDWLRFTDLNSVISDENKRTAKRFTDVFGEDNVRFNFNGFPNAKDKILEILQ